MQYLNVKHSVEVFYDDMAIFHSPPSVLDRTGRDRRSWGWLRECSQLSIVTVS